jgi:MoaA/NifB/PqqE/SkfB family radical SAM enzyme
MGDLRKKIKKLFSKTKYDLSYASEEFNHELLKEYNTSRPLGPQDTLCFAPFKNIYFGHYGKASVCCYNRDFVIGKYPEQSIQEIWQSKEANHLRESIQKNNLDFGCHLCKKHILAKNFDANKAKQYDTATLNANNFPSVMEFELSNVCNLECTMCNGTFSSKIRQNREGLAPIPLSYDSQFVKQLEKFIPHLEEVKFYGGEPFLIEIYYEIWNKIIEIKPSIRISVQTNATILNKRVKDILNKANFHINISIDSLQKESYEDIRVHSDYDRVMQNINWFQNYTQEKKTFFGISACLMIENYQELPNFIEYCNEKHAAIYFHFVDFPEQKALKNLSKEALKEVYSFLETQKFVGKTSLANKNIAHYKDTLKQIKFLLNSSSFTKKEIGEIPLFIEAFSKQILQMPYFNEAEKQKKIALVKEALLQMDEKISDKEILTRTLKELNFNDAMASREALKMFESKSIEELVAMINQRAGN